MIRIAFVVTGLDVGGAETMLQRLILRIDRRRYAPVVISLTTRGSIAERIEAGGVPVHAIGMDRTGLPVAAFVRLVRLLRDVSPHVIQGWMYHGNIAAALAGRCLKQRVPVIWNVRGMLNDSVGGAGWRSRLIVTVSGLLSGVPARIVNNSLISARHHESAHGYPSANRVVLPNGFETETFRPSDDARRALRRELDVEPDSLLIAMYARFDPMKNHRSFLQAAAVLRRAHPDVRFVLAGSGMERENRVLREQCVELGLDDVVFLLGHRDDMSALAAAPDIVTLASDVEGFPNAIGEAMSCGVPCVVTDVGDCRTLLGDTGLVVPRRDPQSLAAAWAQLLGMGVDARRALGERARRRIEEHYSLDRITTMYEHLYEGVVAEAGH